MITNLPEVELLHNRVSLSKQTEGFRWPLRMKTGHHELVARGSDATGKAHEERAAFEYIGEKNFMR